MKRESYMSKNEMIDFLKLGILAGEASSIADRTPEKDWVRKLRCISTYCDGIIKERLSCLDKKQLNTVDRRWRHTEVKLYTSDEYRANANATIDETITVESDNLEDLIDMAMLSCLKCSQGENVKGCRMREIFHKLGCPPLRTNPAEGECEFRCDNEVRSVNPQYRRIEE